MEKTGLMKEVVIVAFNWTKFDTSFLLDVIEASDLSEKSKQQALENSEDKEYLVSKFNKICQSPDRQFIIKYRKIKEAFYHR